MCQLTLIERLLVHAHTIGNQGWPKSAKCMEQAADEIESLKNQVKELEQDKERLDWLYEQGGVVTNGFRLGWFRGDRPTKSLREAIDAARHS